MDVEYRLHLDESIISNTTVMRIDGFILKILPLEEQLLSNIIKGNHERAHRIVKCLEKQGCDRKYLQDAIQRNKFPSDFVTKIYWLFGEG